jgi:bile acid:Na+ symporter, BASS family
MPLVAILMARLLDLPWQTELALVVLAICAGAPLLPKKLLKFGGDPSYVFSLIVTTSLLAIVTVPLSLNLLSRHFSAAGQFDIDASEVARLILASFLVPLGLGMLLRLVAPGVADRISDPLMKIAGAIMALLALVVLAYGLPQLAEIGWRSVAAFALFALAALAAGHALGGPDPGNRTSLAVATASRHIGLALLVAASVKGPHALARVTAYLLGSAIVSVPYLRWRSKAVTPPAA